MKIEQKIQKIVKDTILEMNCNPYDINDGRCGEFASRVADKLESIGIECERPCEDYAIKNCYNKNYTSHYWVYIPKTGKNYDAECPEGVKNAVELPIFQSINDVWEEDEVLDNKYTNSG